MLCTRVYIGVPTNFVCQLIRPADHNAKRTLHQCCIQWTLLRLLWNSYASMKRQCHFWTVQWTGMTKEMDREPCHPSTEHQMDTTKIDCVVWHIILEQCAVPHVAAGWSITPFGLQCVSVFRWMLPRPVAWVRWFHVVPIFNRPNSTGLCFVAVYKEHYGTSYTSQMQF